MEIFFSANEIQFLIKDTRVLSAVQTYLKSVCFDLKVNTAHFCFNQNIGLNPNFKVGELKVNSLNYSKIIDENDTDEIIVVDEYYVSFIALNADGNEPFAYIFLIDTKIIQIDAISNKIHAITNDTFLKGALNRFLKLEATYSFEALFDNSLALMCIASADGKFLKVNQAFTDSLGYTKEELLELPFMELIHPDDHLSTIDVISRLSGGLKVIKYENRYITRNGEIKNFSWSVNPDVATGYFFCTAVDVTLERNNELKMKSIVKEMLQLKFAIDESAIVVSTDIRGTIISVNDKFCDISKYSRNELIGQNHRIVNSGYHSKDFFLQMWQTLAKGKIWKGEIRNKAKDGTIYWVDTTIVPLFDEMRKPYEFIAIRNDITPRKRLMEELETASQLVVQNMKAKDAFLSNMSHEIRTPMNAIIGFYDILSKTKLTKEQDDYVRIISSASNNLLVIINDILDYSKIESGKMELESVPFSIADAVKSVVKLSESKAKDKGIKLLSMLDSDIPVWVLGDTVRLQQILINLTSNAIKFTSKGKVEISVLLDKIDNQNAMVLFSVKDSGIGIPANKLNKIFERFEQVSASTTREFGGTGLGLSIVKMLTELFGGTIEVFSTEGQGTEFKVLIPFEITSQQQVIENKVEASFQQNVESIMGKRLLLVEDNPLNQKLATKILSNHKVEIDYAHDGKEAVEKVKANKYDFVLMDIQMPIMDGYEATKLIRNELKSDVPIIGCTAHSMVSEKQKCLELGMNNYISKPYHEHELLRIISSSLNNESVENVDNQIVELEEVEAISYADKILELDDKFGKEFTQDILNIFLTEIPDEILEFKDAYETKNFERLVFLAHKFKGYLAVLNLDADSKLSGNIEDAAKINDFKTVQKNFFPLMESFKLIFEAIRNYR